MVPIARLKPHVTLEQAWARGLEVRAELEALKKSATAAGQAIKAEKWVRPADLTNLAHYGHRVDREIREWTARIAAQAEVIRNQEEVVVQAKRNVRLLEKLRDQRRADWQSEANREADRATDDFLASKNSRTRRNVS